MVAQDDDPGALSTFQILRSAVADEIGWRWPREADGATGGMSGEPAGAAAAGRADGTTGGAGAAAGMATLHRHAMLPPGKLLRPVLLLCSALATGGSLYATVPAAVGFEAAHVGSLLHDDIIDQDGERRGRPAAHTVFGPGKAIVAGNALYFEWFSALAECARRGIPVDRVALAMQVQSAAGSRVCGGAYDEITMAGAIDSTVEEYLRMAEAKTAVLFEAACRVGAVLAGAEKPVIDAVGRFGHHLGVAFQLRDDLLPYDAPDTEGKPPVSDLRNRRPTLPVLLAYRGAGPADRDAMRRALLGGDDPASALTAMRGLLTRLGALDTARAMVHEEADLACAALARLRSDDHAYTAVLLHAARRLSVRGVPSPDPSGVQDVRSTP